LGPLAVALVAACAGRDGELDDRELLTAILREAPARVLDVAPILVHPQELKLAGIDDPYPGVSPDHYHAGSWGTLAEAAASVGVPLCEVSDAGFCQVDETSELPGFIAVSGPVVSRDMATAWVAATELSGPYGYAARLYQIELARRDSVWEVVEWRPRGSAN
jgi:hypothetical protein